MPQLTIMPSGKSIHVAEGTSILQAILSSGESLPHKCDGKAECGSCHVFILEGRKSLSKTQSLENSKLDTIVGVGSKSRLACQALLGGENITVEILSFS
ncbi:MAG: 2Fe-2S iron-sulfur cluster binding domain-containing protein [Ferrovum sp.]|nr:2Fe-2S iron-sulfur cluster binding domain-containing protein [Ferrovum sp.]